MTANKVQTEEKIFTSHRIKDKFPHIYKELLK